MDASRNAHQVSATETECELALVSLYMCDASSMTRSRGSSNSFSKMFRSAALSAWSVFQYVWTRLRTPRESM